MTYSFEEMEAEIKKAILETYTDKVFRPVPESLRARNAVAAQLLRDMAGGLAHIAVGVLEGKIDEYAMSNVETERHRIFTILTRIHPENEADYKKVR